MDDKMMKELEAKTAELYAEEECVPCGAEEELEVATMRVYGEKAPLIFGVAAAGSGTATYALVDYSFAGARTLWVYIGGAWKAHAIGDAEVASIAKVVMECNRLDVWWSDGTINMIRCWKTF